MWLRPQLARPRWYNPADASGEQASSLVASSLADLMPTGPARCSELCRAVLSTPLWQYGAQWPRSLCVSQAAESNDGTAPERSYPLSAPRSRQLGSALGA